MIGVYCITNKINGHRYIGASIDIENRWQRHRRIYKNSTDKEYNKTLYRAIRKYGLENFLFSVLEECEQTDIYNKEKQWISFYHSDIEGYNETSGGEYGSKKGHCIGEKNGRAKLTEDDVINIRQAYKNLEKSSNVYLKYKDKITLGGFKKVWIGKTWRHIMPETYSIENKRQQKIIGSRSSIGEKSWAAKLNEKDIVAIRKRKNNGENKNNVFLDYKIKISKVSFEQVWYGMTWKHVRI